MTVLLLRLAGPMQAWGVSSRFTVRDTEPAPTKSGVIGMLAAAVGRRRTDPIEDLLSLSFGVRKDQPGSVIRDFHTARTLDGKTSMPLSNRYYIADAVFLAGIEGDRSLLEGLDAALRHPVFPLYLGRRSCPPTQPVSLGLREAPLFTALQDESWQASEWFQRRKHGAFRAEVLIDQDAVPTSERRSAYGSRDVPASFDPRRRDYGFRNVERQWVELGIASLDPHDPMTELEEAQQCS
ncbi:CRISPR-associated protein cas5 family protein [Actinomyces sp. Chiba101]|uniref:type I-E CRISPR-associated protein Cas5/CasD n=1 Tax=Actinomyces TaxID=1654 RepID=UPI000974F2CA|nr:MULTISPECIES: type I-E CRISPR-associated protein Cas5/CasD [Actinomyces]BAW92698.1 CRISPR-associated protein cas5 family protein [Actinomyces sp. Chiba101]GAV94337.1 CRISPR-associated protein cas5 family protein [Actinomyces denticolens]SUU07566.1 CRISPR-associated protein Cas5/CasD, subtype I-E/ECOLI [Actinomyces denticolens]